MRILLGALLVVVALSMLTYLVPDYGGGATASDIVVAQIGKDAVTTIEVQRAVQNMMKGRQLPSELLGSYLPQIIDNIINERALAFEAERLGYQVTDADVAQAIQQMVPSLFQDGKFVGKETYAAMLAQQNVTIPEFEKELKRSLLVSRLRNVAAEGVVVTPAEIENEYRKRSEKVKIEWVKVSGDKYRKDVPVSDEEMRKFFGANTPRYQVPEKKSLAILIADQAKLEQTVTASDADLLRLYNQNKDSFRTADRVKVRHILLKTSEKPPAEEAKMKAKADDLLAQIRKGGNFAELAKANSEDTGSAKTGGELPDWVSKGQTVPEFEKTAFSLPVNQVSDVVKTQYGYHILQVLQKEQARLRPFEEAKAELSVQWKKQRVSDLMDQASTRAQSALQKDPANPEKVAAEFNLTLAKANDAAPGDPLPEIGVAKDFEESVLSLKKGEVSQPVALPGNKIAFAVVTAVSPARPSTFDEVKAQVREAIVTEKLTDVVAKRADELADKAKGMGGDLKKAAQSMGLEVKTSDDFTRNGAVEGMGSAAYLKDVFARPDGSLLGPLGIVDGKVVVKVLTHTPPDMSQLAAQRSAIRDEIKGRRARDRSQLFEAGLRQALIKQGKIKIHQDVITRMTANYRSGA